MDACFEDEEQLSLFQRSMSLISKIVLEHNVGGNELKLALAILQAYSIQSNGFDAKTNMFTITLEEEYPVVLDKAYLSAISGVDRTNISKYLKSLHHKGVMMTKDGKTFINPRLFKQSFP